MISFWICWVFFDVSHSISPEEEKEDQGHTTKQDGLTTHGVIGPFQRECVYHKNASSDTSGNGGGYHEILGT